MFGRKYSIVALWAAKVSAAVALVLTFVLVAVVVVARAL